MLSEGIYDEQSRKQGLWKYYFVTGELKEQGAYKNDKKTGTWKFFFINGDVEQIGEYVQDLPEGTWRWYYANKQVRLEEEYIDGFLFYAVESDELAKAIKNGNKPVAGLLLSDLAINFLAISNEK